MELNNDMDGTTRKRKLEDEERKRQIEIEDDDRKRARKREDLTNYIVKPAIGTIVGGGAAVLDQLDVVAEPLEAAPQHPVRP